MKIKLFYKQNRQTLADFEKEVNEFMRAVNVVKVECTESLNELVVLYEPKTILAKVGQPWVLVNGLEDFPYWSNRETGLKVKQEEKESFEEFIERLEVGNYEEVK